MFAQKIPGQLRARQLPKQPPELRGHRSPSRRRWSGFRLPLTLLNRLRFLTTEAVIRPDAGPGSSPTEVVVSRATVYNTLRLFVAKGLLRQYQIAEGPTVYDANVERHHHLIDEDTGRVIDIPWDAVEVSNVEGLEGFDVQSYMVVLRGRRRDDRG